MTTDLAKPEERIVSFTPFGAADAIKLTVSIIQNLIAIPTKSGKTCSVKDGEEVKARCECPDEGKAVFSAHWYSSAEQAGMFHFPGKCKCTNKLRRYRRGRKVLWLCSCCNIKGLDKPVRASKRKASK